MSNLIVISKCKLRVRYSFILTRLAIWTTGKYVQQESPPLLLMGRRINWCIYFGEQFANMCEVEELSTPWHNPYTLPGSVMISTAWVSPANICGQNSWLWQRKQRRVGGPVFLNSRTVPLFHTSSLSQPKTKCTTASWLGDHETHTGT